MMDRKEREVRNLLDRLDPRAVRSMSGVSESSEAPLDADILERIKQRTKGKLELQYMAAATSKKRKRGWAIAAACVLFLSASAIASTTNVGAELRKVLQFLPGLGIVTETPVDQTTLVLGKPYVHRFGASEISVDAVAVTGDQVLVQLSGSNSASAEYIQLKIEDGASYSLKFSTLTHSGSWIGTYYYQGSLPVHEGSRITLVIGDQEVGPLTLIPATQGEDMSKIGSSDTQQDITITAVTTPLSDGWTKVNFLSRLPGNRRIQSYGAQPITPEERLLITDADGKEAEIKVDHYGFLLQNEAVYRDPSAGKQPHTLTLPSVLVVNPSAEWRKVTLPVPETGAVVIQESVTLDGFPVQFTKVERSLEGGVLIEVDLGFDMNKTAALQTVKIDRRQPEDNGYSWSVHEDSLAMKSIHLPAEPKAKSITFYIGEPQVVIRGPWRIPLVPPPPLSNE
ncbi:hypothetical protein RAC89_23830 [Paenibacillus sp. GD4]|uniref:hypothetical protein n=1 Tax=Paenibacillus sp. GD4 TaxID=3068890 RepID=UPI0027963EE1|nr:hypothetical protein [Paenibacillus sp. GD4]MDQ1913432.1 hypothetical protein [Paenibacillus sp. GD4]